MPPDKEVKKQIKDGVRFQNFFKVPDGDFVLEQIDMLCGYRDDVFHPDSYKHAYNSGKRSVAVAIHMLLEKNLGKELDNEM